MASNVTNPTQTVQLTPSDLQDPSLGTLNNLIAQLQTQINQLNGSSGKTVLPSGVDVSGSTVSNVGAPQSPTDAVSKAHADANYSAAAIAPQLESGAKVGLKTYRALNSKSQSEQSSTFLYGMLNTSPTTNTSTVSATSPSGGSITVTCTAGYHTYPDSETITPYAQRSDALPVPSSGQYCYYYYIQGQSRTLSLSKQFDGDSQYNRLAVNYDGTCLIAVVVIDSSGLVVEQSAGGATPFSETGGNPILTRL